MIVFGNQGDEPDFVRKAKGCGRAVAVRCSAVLPDRGGAQNLPFVGKVLRTVPSPDGLAGAVRPSKPASPSMNAPTAFPDQQKPVPPYKHTPLFPLGPDTTPYKKITAEGVRVEKVLSKDMLVVSREALRALSEAAFGDINHYLRPGHLKQLRNILDDKEASDNDKFVAFDFLKNANIASVV